MVGAATPTCVAHPATLRPDRLSRGLGAWLAVRSASGPDEPIPQLLVVAEADQLHQAPVVPMVRRVKQAVLPVLGVLAQSVDHIVDSLVEGGAIGDRRYNVTSSSLHFRSAFKDKYVKYVAYLTVGAPGARRVAIGARARPSPYGKHRRSPRPRRGKSGSRAGSR